MPGKNCLQLAGRLLMASLFVWDGILGLRQRDAVARYYETVHIPEAGVMVWVVSVVLLVCGIALIAGFKTRWAAAVLAAFCLITAFAVHLPAGNDANMMHFYKNLVMAGGFLYLVAYGAGRFSIDGESG
jgi:putative oxidoreductase